MREIEINTTRTCPRPASAATEERYRRMVAEWARGGETAEDVAARHGIAARTLKWWRSELKRRDRGEPVRRRSMKAAELLPVRVTAAWGVPGPRPTHFEVALRGGQRVVRIPVGFDPADVRALVDAVDGEPC